MKVAVVVEIGQLNLLQTLKIRLVMITSLWTE